MKNKSVYGPALCVLLEGGDSIGRDNECARVLAKLRAQYPSIEDLPYDWSGEPFSSFAEQCRTPSLFSSQRLARVKHVEMLTDEELALLAQIIDSELPDIFLVLTASPGEESKKRGGKSSRRESKFADVKKLIQQKAAHLPQRIIYKDFPKPREYEIARWLTAQTPALFNRSISLADAELFVDITGYDFDLLYSELQKLDIILPAGAPIDRDAVIRFAGINRDAQPFELAHALGRKDVMRVLNIVDNLYAQTPSGPLCISVLYKHFWTRFKVLLFARNNREKIQKYLHPPSSFSARKQIQEEVGLAAGVFAGILGENQRGSVYPLMIKDGVIESALTLKEEHYRSIFHWLADYDRSIKTGRLEDSKMSMQFLCYKIARVSQDSRH